jgi:hypothetical protein
MTATSNRPVRTQPWLHQRGHEVQAFGTVRQFPVGLSAEARVYSARVGEQGDDGTNDLLVSEVIRTGELQAWFLAEHLVDTRLVRIDRHGDQ